MSISAATFIASFPPIQSAIKITGDGNGMRLQLDVPETEMGEAVKVLAWRECALKITIEPLENSVKQRDHIGRKTGNNKQPKWETKEG